VIHTLSVHSEPWSFLGGTSESGGREEPGTQTAGIISAIVLLLSAAAVVVVISSRHGAVTALLDSAVS
jgi:hypothetical protein